MITHSHGRGSSRRPARPRLSILVGAGAALLVGAPAAGQIRPLDPIPWADFDLAHGSASIGASVYSDQTASRAGVEGRMTELGAVRGVVRVGRVLFEAAGTAWRFLDERSTVLDPVAGIRAAENGRRADVGDYRFSTTVLLTDPVRPWGAAFRFGARLPTTDETAGLERDETDLFFTVATQWKTQGVRFFAESGVGIFGVVRDFPDQTDPVLYMMGFQVPRDHLSAGLEVVGHYDTRTTGAPRGNEDLSELRFRLRSEGRLWGEVVALKGLASFSPGYGIELRFGRTF